ncbi:MAG: GNAT family N-acetyltransferase [Microbacterium sp.]
MSTDHHDFAPVDATAFRTAPVDEASRARLADGGLEYRLVPVESEAYEPWLQVVTRGFLGPESTDEQTAAIRERSGYRRTTGVYDPTTPVADAPVATIASWIAPLTVPGGSSILSCAISAVTVAPTHRRRGIARAMLEGELRAAAAAGAPMAMLTVSESPLYGRYGFAPAAAAATWRIDVKRASWIGPRPSGRVDFIPRETARDHLQELHPRVRRRDAGEIGLDPAWWDGFAGTRPDAQNAGGKRAVRYADADGALRGVAVYSVRENDDDFTKATVTLSYLVADTDDAYAALWRFFIELDLVAEVRADLLSVDEPLLWMLSDQRAATVTVSDHQYVRILDVPTALEARSYGAAGELVLDVADPLGFAHGRWLLSVDGEGRGTVSPLDPGHVPDGATEVVLGIEELSAVYLGGVSLATLAAAGRVQSADAATAARVFGWHRAPRLSIWY